MRSFRIKPFVDLVGVSTTAAMLRVIGQLDQVFPVLDSRQLHDGISSHNARTVYAKKPYRVEFLLERIHAFAQQVRAAAQEAAIPKGGQCVLLQGGQLGVYSLRF